MNERLTEKNKNGFYKLKNGQEIYGEENGIRLVQIVGQYEDIDEDPEHLAKVKKALEIMKPYLNKIVGMNVYDRDFYECFIQVGNKRIFISKEKYDLLKEVLL